MLVSVLLKEKQFFISCGPATQPASWLAHTACLRYDASLGQHLGPPVALCRADGEPIGDWTQPLHRCVKDGEQLVVTFAQQAQQGEQRDDDYALTRPDEQQQSSRRHVMDEEERDEDEEAEEEEVGLDVRDRAALSGSSDSEDDNK